MSLCAWGITASMLFTAKPTKRMLVQLALGLSVVLSHLFDRKNPKSTSVVQTLFHTKLAVMPSTKESQE